VRMSQVPPGRYLSLFTSRGCPYQCSYCHRLFGKRFRKQSAERIVAEIEYYVRRFNIHEMAFLDDVFNLDKQRVLEFSRLVRSKGLNLRLDFASGLRGDLLDEETIDALIDAGMYRSSFGLESGSRRIQAFIGKHLDIDRFICTVELAARKRVFTHGFAMLGFPTETERELQTTIEVASASRLHTAAFFTVVPFPNTDLYEAAQQRYPEEMNRLCYDDTDLSSISLNLSDVPDELFFAYRRKAWRSFYLKPGRMFRIVRDYPHPWFLPRLVPTFLRRVTSGRLL